jgi:hypothetical protein
MAIPGAITDSELQSQLVDMDAKALKHLVAVAEERAPGTARWAPVLCALGKNGVSLLASLSSCFDPEVTKTLKTADLAPLIIDMREMATARGCLEDELLGILREDGYAVARTLNSLPCRPRECPHFVDGGAWLLCGPGGCGGFSCSECGLPRPHPWKGCPNLSLCRYAEPELTLHPSACSLLRAPMPGSASAKIKPLVDLVRGSLVNHRNRLLEHGMCTVTTPDPVNKSGGLLVTPGAPMKHDSFVGVCFEAMKLQNNNQPMPADMRPKIQDLIACIEHLELDPPSIPELAQLKPGFGEDPPPPRFRLLRDVNDALTCLAVAMSPEMGSGHLRYLTNAVPSDEINAKFPGSDKNITTGANILKVNSFGRTATAFCEDQQADNFQTVAFFTKMWNTRIRKQTENKRNSLTMTLEEIASMGFELPPKEAKVANKKGAGGGGRGGGSSSRSGRSGRGKSRYPSDSDSDSDGDDKRKGKNRNKDKGRSSGRSDRSDKDKDRKKKEKADRRKRKDSSDESNNSGSDSDDSVRGGSVLSKLPCYAFMFDKKGCRTKDCEYSHRREVIKKYKDDKKKGKSKKNDDDE